MSSYFYELYFTDSVQQATVKERVQNLPGIKPDPQSPDQFWIGRVHLMIDGEDAEEMIPDIQSRTGIRTGNFSLDVGVHSFSQADTNLMLDTVLDILSGGEDAVAVYLSEQIMLMQKNGQLSADGSRMSEDSLSHLRRRRDCPDQNLGPVF